jgi:hypothetical protein
MSRLKILPLFLVLSASAFAKPNPIPCSDLWSALTDTLSNPGNYSILATNDEQMKASFIVVGSLYPAKGVVSLQPKKEGCELQINMGFTGNNGDEFTFRKRVNRALTKRKAALPSQPAHSTGAGG